jgi:hypothetical protein
MIYKMDQYKSGLWHLVGSASVACVSGLASAGLIVTSFTQGQAATVLFSAFTAVTAYWATSYALAAAGELLSIYSREYSRAEELRLDNLRLRKRLMWQAQQRRAEGEADGAGGTVPSANVRFIMPKRIN